MSKELEDYKNVVDFFGVEHQQRKMDEEYGELTRALTTYFTRLEAGLPVNKYAVMTEIADMHNMLKQFMAYLEIPMTDVKPEMGFKLRRTLSNIEEEKKKRCMQDTFLR